MAVNDRKQVAAPFTGNYRQGALPWHERGWQVVARNDARARALADRHYSRQTPGAIDFMGSGQLLVLLTDCERAVWGVILNREPGTARMRWRCSIFRNEGAGLSSELIESAYAKSLSYWRRRYGGAPAVRMTTEIDAGRVRHKRDPGRCFLRAGWERLYETNGASKGRRDLIVLGAPIHSEAMWGPE